MIQNFKIFLKNHLFLFLILIFYLCLVFYNFKAQGLINWDEGYLLVVTHTFSDILRTFFFEPKTLLEADYYKSLISNYGNVYTASRPSYIFFATLIDLIYKSDYSTRLLNIIIGCFIIIFLYKILNFYGIDKKLKILTLIFLLFSPLFLIYSRLGLSQFFSALLLLLALFFLLKFKENGKIRELNFSALATGFLLMSHYNTILLVIILIFYSCFLLYRKQAGIKNFFIYLFSFSLIPVLWEIISRIVIFFANKKIPLTPKQKIYSYFGEILEQVRRSSKGINLQNLIFDQPLYYLKLLISSENFIIFILIILGLFLAFKNIKKFQYQILFVITFLFLLLSSTIYLKFPRNIIVLLPIFYLFTAFGLEIILKIISKKLISGTIFLVLIFGTIVLNFNQYLNIFNIRTNFQEIANFIKKNYSTSDVVICSSSAPIWRIYLAGYKVEALSEVETWKGLQKEGRKVIIIADYFTEIDNQYKFFEKEPKKLIKQYPTNIFNVKTIILDFTYRSEKEIENLFEKNRDSQINIYVQ